MNPVDATVTDRGDGNIPIEVISQPSPTAPAAEVAESPIWDDAGDFAAETPERGFPWIVLLLAMTAMAWVGWFAFSVSRGFAVLPPEADFPALVATATIPLIALLIIWIVLDRGSARSVQRHLRLLATLRSEQHMLTDRLAMIDRHWHSAQATLNARADQFAVATLESGQRVEAMTLTVETRMRDAAAAAAVIAQQGDMALRQMDGLVVALPKVDEVARRAADNFKQAGQSAYQYGGRLEERIAALQAETAEAERVIGGADAALERRIAALTEAAVLAEQSSRGAAARFEAALDMQRENALAMLADLATSLEAGCEQVEQRLADARRRMADSSTAQLAELRSGVTDAEVRTTALGTAIESGVAQSHAANSILLALAGDMGARLAAFETEAEARMATVSRLFGTLQSGFDMLSQSTDGSNAQAVQLIERVADCVAALEGATRQVDTALPAALARLQDHVAASRDSLAALPPLIDASSEGAGVALARLHEAEVLLEQQAATLTALDRGVVASLEAQSSAIAQLADAVARLDGDIRRVAEEAAPALVSGVEQSERSATASAERARCAIAAAASDSASDIERVIAEAIDGATGDAVANRIGSIGEAAERAVSAANTASDRLMRQLITIADSSAAIEARVGEVSAKVADHDRDTLSQQMALTSEALQSTAVDMTRLLSTEVADQAWDAYMRGDRGIFARRAVRLLTATEARDVLRRYQDDDEFRGLVNRYIHDFEAMLRGVMDTRAGSALAVTLLSSDIGKVYVALAQAIERLRG